MPKKIDVPRKDNVKKIDVKKKDNMMPPDLASRIEPIRLKLAQSTKVTCSVRYEIGLVVKEVRGPRAPYSARAMHHLEVAFAIDANTLIRYQRVVETWDAAEFNKNCIKEMKGGQPVSWSHFEVLADVMDESRREDLLAEVIAEGLSVRKLRERVRRSAAAESSVQAANTSADHLAILQIANQVVEVARNAKRLASFLPFTPQAATPEMMDALGEARAAYEDFLKASQETLEMIVSAQRVLRPGPVAKAAAV